MTERIKSPDSINLELVQGIAQGVQSETISEIVSSSSSGYVGQHTGSAQSTTSVTSRQIEKTKFFLQMDSGKERSFTFSNLNFYLRDGHRVRIVTANAIGSNTSQFVYLENENTDKIWQSRRVFSDYTEQPYPLWQSILLIVGAVLFGYFVLFGGDGFDWAYIESLMPYSLIASALGIYLYYRRQSQTRTRSLFTDTLNARLDALIARSS